MKKFTTTCTSLLLALTLCASLAACSNDDSSTDSTADSSSASSAASDSAAEEVSIFGAVADFDYLNFTADQGLTAEGMWEGVTASDYVTLPEDFATVTVPTAEVTPTDESIQYQLSMIANSYATTETITDRPAQEGDVANIDYAGSVGGVLFTGGTAQGYDLTLGSGKFIPGFEEAIVGHEVGETFDIVVTFPQGYSDSADADGNVIVLSGAEVTFEITLNSLTLTVVPELTDDWVYEKLYATAGIINLKDLTEEITHELFLQNVNIYVWDYITQNAEISSVPASLIHYQVCTLLSYYDSVAFQNGLELNEFITQKIGLESADAFLTMQQEGIQQYAELALLQQAIAEQLDLAVTDEIMEGYSAYLATNPEAFVALNALKNLVDATLVEGAVLS